jgi:hypothetical protein
MKKLLGIIGMVFLLFACGTTGKQHSAKQNLANEERDTLSYEQRRKYNYFFLEAVRLKQKGEYDAAFELYKHCLDIYPGSRNWCWFHCKKSWCLEDQEHLQT